MKKLFTLALAIILVSACTNFKMAPSTDDRHLKQFISPKNTAGVYIFRNQMKGHILLMDVDDQQLVWFVFSEVNYTRLPPKLKTSSKINRP